MRIRSTSLYSQLMALLKPPKMLLMQQARPKLTLHKTKPLQSLLLKRYRQLRLTAQMNLLPLQQLQPALMLTIQANLLLLMQLHHLQMLQRPLVMNLMGMEILKPSLMVPTLSTIMLKQKLQTLSTPEMLLRVTETIFLISTQHQFLKIQRLCSQCGQSHSTLHKLLEVVMSIVSVTRHKTTTTISSSGTSPAIAQTKKMK